MSPHPVEPTTDHMIKPVPVRRYFRNELMMLPYSGFLDFCRTQTAVASPSTRAPPSSDRHLPLMTAVAVTALRTSGLEQAQVLLSLGSQLSIQSTSFHLVDKQPSGTSQTNCAIIRSETLIGPINRGDGGKLQQYNHMPFIPVASRLCIVSTSELAFSLRRHPKLQIALCRPPRCLTVVSLSSVIPMELPPPKSHRFQCSPACALLICTSTWYSRERPRIPI